MSDMNEKLFYCLIVGFVLVLGCLIAIVAKVTEPRRRREEEEARQEAEQKETKRLKKEAEERNRKKREQDFVDQWKRIIDHLPKMGRSSSERTDPTSDHVAGYFVTGNLEKIKEELLQFLKDNYKLDLSKDHISIDGSKSKSNYHLTCRRISVSTYEIDGVVWYDD